MAEPEPSESRLEGASVGALRAIIASAGLRSDDCVEKFELRERAAAAMKILDRSAPAPSSPPQTTTQTAGIHARPDLEGHERPEYNDFARASRVAHVPRLLDEKDIASVHALASAVGPHQINKAGKISWKTSYLNSGHRFNTHLPALKAKLIQAARDVDVSNGWNVLSGVESDKLGVRVAEHHTVSVGGCLPWIHHRDWGSLVTIDVMLSSPGDFEGGTFQTSAVDGSLTAHTGFEHGDALIFISHKPHSACLAGRRPLERVSLICSSPSMRTCYGRNICASPLTTPVCLATPLVMADVAPVTRGTRRVLVVELWLGEDRPCARRCNTNFGECTCEYDIATEAATGAAD